MVNTTYNSTEVLINKLQQLKGKKKLKFCKNICNYYDETNIRNFQFEQDPFSKNTQGIIKNHHKLFLLMKFLQTKPQVKIMNINNYDLYYTVLKNRYENEIVQKKMKIVRMILLNMKVLLYLSIIYQLNLVKQY